MAGRNNTIRQIWVGGRRKYTPEYKSWQHLKERCLNPNLRCYKHYGGRGIKVCDRWRYSFESFLEDMGKRPNDKSSIDRIDNDGNYEPSNCRWADQSEQMHNTRTRADNTTGHRGVHWSKKAKLYVAYCSIGGKKHHLGYYKGIEDAIQARKDLLSNRII